MVVSNLIVELGYIQKPIRELQTAIVQATVANLKIRKNLGTLTLRLIVIMVATMKIFMTIMFTSYVQSLLPIYPKQLYPTGKVRNIMQVILKLWTCSETDSKVCRLPGRKSRVCGSGVEVIVCTLSRMPMDNYIVVELAIIRNYTHAHT